MKRCIRLLAVMVSLGWASAAWAAPTLDGKADPLDGYGAAKSVQNTNTQFGNSTTGDPIQNNGGNEIDQVFATVSGGKLYVTVAGNLKMGFDKMDVFIDSIAGGRNTLGAGLPVVDEYCCDTPTDGEGALQRMGGLSFDTGFDADYYLTFANGSEPLVSTNTGNRDFWAISAHYADINNDANGMSGTGLGMQTAYRGQPNVLRFPGDFNKNGKVDGADYVTWRDHLAQAAARGANGDVNGNGTVDDVDYKVMREHFDDGTTLGDYAWVPNDVTYAVSEALLGPQLPSLAAGQLIDKNYAGGAGGCSVTGANCVAAELEFAQAHQRNFDNSVVGLQLAFDNSNNAGVSDDDGPTNDFTTPTADNPQDVRTGVEFSIPLASIGNPTGPIKLTVFINNGGHDYLSNQFSGAGALSVNIGSIWDNNSNATLPFSLLDIAGDQFVIVANPGAGSSLTPGSVPEPGTLFLALVAGLTTCGFVRRK